MKLPPRLRPALLACLTALGAALLPAAANAQAVAASKPTTAQELVGCYERINFTPAMMQEMNKTEYWPQPYQYFCFLPDGTFASMMSDKPRRGSAESLRKTLEVLPQVFTYGFQSGFIVIQSVDGRESTVWDAMILLEDSNTVDGTPTPKGTLVMGMLAPDASGIEYWRYLKPLR